MASKTAETAETESSAESSDSPLLDMSDAGVKKMIKAAKARGWVTYDELNKVLPSEEFSSEQIEDTMAMLSEMGITVVENDETEDSSEEASAAEDDEDEEAGVPAKAASSAVTKSESTSTTLERTDDPVRMYLREMGSVELLSREGEIAIAKRIEAGRETMIAGLCESPLTFQAIIIWRDELNDGKILLRDIIDLDATYAGPDAKKIDRSQAALEREKAKAEGREVEEQYEVQENDDDDDEDNENSLSLAAMEAELKPKVLETFDAIASNYKKLRKLQDQKHELVLQNEDLSSAQVKRYKKLRDEIVEEVKSLSLNNNRIDSLVEQLYAINKRLMMLEGRLLRLAESHGVKRQEFLTQYYGNEMDPNWVERVAKLKAKGWSSVAKEEKDTLENLRAEIQELVQETGLDISEYRRIVHTVQKGEREARQAKKEMVEANLRGPELGRARGQAESQGLVFRCQGRKRHAGKPARGNSGTGAGNRSRHFRIPPHRAHGAEGRARGAPGQEGNGGSEPASRYFHRQKIHEPRPAIPRSHSGRQYRPDESGG